MLKKTTKSAEGGTAGGEPPLRERWQDLGSQACSQGHNTGLGTGMGELWGEMLACVLDFISQCGPHDSEKMQVKYEPQTRPWNAPLG